MFKTQLETLGLDTTQGPPLEAVIKAQQERAKTMEEMAAKSTYFYKDFVEMDIEAKKKNITEETIPGLKALRTAFEGVSASEWKAGESSSIVLKTAEDLNIKLGKIAQPLRVAVTGNTQSPPIDITLRINWPRKNFEAARLVFGLAAVSRL